MIARIDVKLRKDELRARMREGLRRDSAGRAVEALARLEDPADIPDEKLTERVGPDWLSRDV